MVFRFVASDLFFATYSADMQHSHSVRYRINAAALDKSQLGEPQNRRFHTARLGVLVRIITHTLRDVGESVDIAGALYK